MYILYSRIYCSVGEAIVPIGRSDRGHQVQPRETEMNDNPIQNFFDTMLDRWRQERSKTQMTLGQLIERLNELDPELEMVGLTEPHSYRGYYADLAFEIDSRERLACEVLVDAIDSLDKTFEGYKGGNYIMASDAPVWIASYGCCGKRLMAVNDDGTIITAEEED